MGSANTDDLGKLSYDQSESGDPYAMSSQTIPLNSFHHVLVVYTKDDQTAKIYIDGVLDTTKTGIPSPDPDTVSDLFIGKDSIDADNGYYFHGTIDEVRIYNRALEESEISEISSGIPPVERAALVDLYHSTGGANWKNSTNWLGPVGTECSWYGITCDADENHVTTVNLNYNNLIGTIPASVSNLKNLQAFNLIHNQLSGDLQDILPEITDLTNLTHINWQLNQLSGNIPPEIGDITSLVYICLTHNQLTGNIPPEIGNLANLETIYLGTNQLTGIPPEIGNLENLQSLHLDINQLAGNIPPEIGNLTNLKSLFLEYNQLSGNIPPEMGNLTSLTRLRLYDNLLTGVIPSEIGNLSNLYYLSLNNNQLEGNIPPEIGNLAGLEYLRFSGNQLTGPVPGEMINLINLLDQESDFRWNALYTTDAPLHGLLDNAQTSGDWESTQTIAPTSLAVGTPVMLTSVPLTWTKTDYTNLDGGYEVEYSTTSGGPYDTFGTTENKDVENIIVSDLTPDTTYYFRIRTFTTPHADNANTVYSEYTDEISAKTPPQQEPLFQEIQSVPTLGATHWESFAIDGEHYLIVANARDDDNFEIDSKIYKWDGDSFEEFQSLATSCAYDWEYFTIGTDHYLIVANLRNNSTNNVDSKIYKWNGTDFAEFQSFSTYTAFDWEFFTIGTDHFLVVTNCVNVSHITDSKVYKWNGTDFEEFQSVLTSGASDWEFFTIGNKHYLAVANCRDDETLDVDSKIYEWNGTDFTEFQSIPTMGANDWEFFGCVPPFTQNET